MMCSKEIDRKATKHAAVELEDAALETVSGGGDTTFAASTTDDTSTRTGAVWIAGSTRYKLSGSP